MADIRLGYFLEDVGQEAFIITLANRIAEGVGLTAQDLHHDPRSVIGGEGRAMSELRRFLLDVNRGLERVFDVLIVAIDSNCQGYTEKRNEILRVVEQTSYPGTVVCALPDPHIERWYLADPQALRQAIGADVQPEAPSYKCERGRYKQALRQALRQADIVAPLGGAEYGPEVAGALDIYTVSQKDTAFKHFVEELRGSLSRLFHVVG